MFCSGSCRYDSLSENYDSLKSIVVFLKTFMQLPTYRLKQTTPAFFHKKPINQKLIPNLKLRRAQFSVPC